MKKLMVIALSGFLLLGSTPIVYAEDATQSQTQSSTGTSQQPSSNTAPITQPSMPPVSSPAETTFVPSAAQATAQATPSIPSQNVNQGSVSDPQVSEIVDIRPISMKEFEGRVMKVFASIITFGRNIATPYMYVGIIIGALILLMPFANPLKKYAGWQTIVTALIAYLLIFWGPVLLGVVRGFTQ